MYVHDAVHPLTLHVRARVPTTQLLRGDFRGFAEGNLWSGRRVYAAFGAVMDAFAEAAMVGGLADWFAVTALFRHPLGLPIPHTAIIPENKDRIADTMAGFLRENFLTPAVVGRRMGSMNLAGAIGSYLADPKATRDSRIQAGAGELAVEVAEVVVEQGQGGLRGQGQAGAAGELGAV